MENKINNIVEIKNLSKKYERFSLDNVSITLPQGFIMGLIGENGAGKTTLIKLIMNLVKKNSGTIEVFGMDNLRFEREIKEKIGFVYDQAYYYDHLTLEENSKMISKLYSKWDDKKFHGYLNKFSLNKNQKLKELSKGMRMKFSLCIALSHGAELIIMDEPTAGMDPIVRSEVLEELQKLMENEKMGMIISTHITEDLEKIADYITLVKDGKILLSKSKDEIFDSYRVVKGEKALLTKESEKLFKGISKNNYGFEALTNNINEVKKVMGEKVVVEKASLEDIMILYKN